MKRELIKTSRFLSLVLRHDPSVVGVELDEAGWIDVATLVDAVRTKRPAFTRALLEEIVATNDKRRFVISDDGLRVRASQGHSIGVDLGLSPVPPPDVLFHGTAQRFLESILDRGLLSGQRDHVHLSAEVTTARQVGGRHGKPVVLVVAATQMADAAYDFYVSANGVWLTETVPSRFLEVS